MTEYTMHSIPEKTKTRFWNKVNKRGPDDCWHWQGAINSDGYGNFSILGKIRQATHAALTINGEDRPTGDAQALHSCDNPPCVNPKHLRWGTIKENMDDRSKRRGRYPCAPIKPNSILSEDQVKYILTSPMMGKDLAVMFGVHKATISDIRCRKIWRHVVL